MKIFKDISCLKHFLLQFLSSVVHGACHLHSELLKYKSHRVTLRFEYPCIFKEVWVSCRAPRPSTMQPGQPHRILSGSPWAHPICSFWLHRALQSTMLLHPVPSWTIPLLSLKPFTSIPCHRPHLLILQDITHIPLSWRLLQYPQADFSTMFLCPHPSHAFYRPLWEHFHKTLIIYLSLPEFSLYKYSLFLFAKIFAPKLLCYLEESL